jgi:hypothetical protein
MLPVAVQAQSLRVRTDGDQLRISAPQLRLLTKEAVERLRDGASVGYSIVIAVSSAPGAVPLEQITYRFVFSYDLWEEKYAVRRLEPVPRAVSHLSVSAAEAWCLDALAIKTARLSADRPFWVSLTWQAETAKSDNVASDDSGLTLGGLVDIFSRQNASRPLSGSTQAGPFRLSEAGAK